MTRRALVLVALIVLGLSAFAACTDNTPTCIPDTVVNDCICRKGDRGHHVCEKDGLHFGQCLCGIAGTGGGSGAVGDSDMGGSESGTGGSLNMGGSVETGGSSGDFGFAGDLSAGGA